MVYMVETCDAGEPLYCMSKGSCLFLYRESLYENRQDFLNMQYMEIPSHASIIPLVLYFYFIYFTIVIRITIQFQTN